MIKKTLRRTQGLLERYVVCGLIQKITWRFRHLYVDNWAENYLDTSHPHRRQIVDAISSTLQKDSILEVGCASGANLILLRQFFPDAKLSGIDINKKATATARYFFQKKGDNNISFYSGDAGKVLKKLPSNSIDIILFDAVLMFITPDQIDKVLKETLRISKKTIIFNEYYKKGAIRGYFQGGRWIYDFPGILEKYKNIQVLAEKSAFTGEEWDVYGNLIKISLENN